ncbi:MAG: GGDEF domain-containing protein [Candidatus Obscuribacterales bacterium]|nr:GGDEF domain-containing protein [Candidatus Obscuribacterales bacterium]
METEQQQQTRLDRTHTDFIMSMRDCTERLSWNDREDALIDAATIFANFAEASDALIIDLSKETLDLYRSRPDDGRKDENQNSTVVMEESLVPVLEFIMDRCLDNTGMRIHNNRIIEPPEDVPPEFLQECFEELGLSSGFVFPLAITRNYGTDKIQGLVLVRNAPPRRFADPLVFALLRMGVDLLSLSSDNCDLGRALSRLRSSDSLTGLATRHQLFSALDKELERSAFFARKFALVMADIDSLKSFVLKNGHLFGDYAIKAVADELMAEARPVDVVCRYGGEEFMVLLPECDEAMAEDFAERCRKRISEHMIMPRELDTDIFVTASFGVVIFPEHGVRKETILNKAELAILQSKLSGRNTVTLWSDHADSLND